MYALELHLQKSRVIKREYGKYNLSASAAGVDVVPVADSCGVLASSGSSVVVTGHDLAGSLTGAGASSLVAVVVVLKTIRVRS